MGAAGEATGAAGATVAATTGGDDDALPGDGWASYGCKHDTLVENLCCCSRNGTLEQLAGLLADLGVIRWRPQGPGGQAPRDLDEGLPSSHSPFVQELDLGGSGAVESWAGSDRCTTRWWIPRIA